MKKINLLNWSLVLLIIFISSSCSKNDDLDDTTIIDEVKSGELTIKIDHRFKNEIFELNKDFFLDNGQYFNASKYRYYLSNVKLISEEGDEYIEVDSYHLIDITGKKEFTLTGIPLGDYKEIQFSLGVDEEKNHEIDNSGDLDANGAMIWSWAIGYKFLVLEGKWDEVTPVSSPLVFHIGLDENYKTITLPLNDDTIEKISLTESELSKTIQMRSDINEIFIEPMNIDLKTHSSAMGGESATDIANNYIDMFSIKSIE